MKLALVNGNEVEATKGDKGQCRSCGSELIAKCGEDRVNHWAHKGKRNCDPWWENETEWHRTWKDQFPAEWQEFVHHAGTGEKHIADVRTERGWVIEFQHSFLKPEERRARDAFYPKLVWVVHATRRKRDRKQFEDAFNNGMRIPGQFLIVKVRSDDCALIREWAGSSTPCFFDFDNEELLVWLIAGCADGWAYFGHISRASFIEMHRGGITETTRDFDELVNTFRRLVTDYELYLQAKAQQQSTQHPNCFLPPLYKKAKSRGRF